MNDTERIKSQFKTFDLYVNIIITYIRSDTNIVCWIVKKKYKKR